LPGSTVGLTQGAKVTQGAKEALPISLLLLKLLNKYKNSLITFRKILFMVDLSSFLIGSAFDIL